MRSRFPTPEPDATPVNCSALWLFATELYRSPLPWHRPAKARGKHRHWRREPSFETGGFSPYLKEVYKSTSSSARAEVAHRVSPLPAEVDNQLAEPYRKSIVQSRGKGSKSRIWYDARPDDQWYNQWVGFPELIWCSLKARGIHTRGWLLY